MDSLPAVPVGQIVQEIDRLIAEMVHLRSQIAALGGSPAQQVRSVREEAYFGMWADRQDMRGLSSREWLEGLRARQWIRP